MNIAPGHTQPPALINTETGEITYTESGLGIYANKVANADSQQVKEKPQRTKLNKIRREIKNRKLASERVCNCGYKPIGSHVELHKNPEHGSVKVANVETCGSVWACPVCRTKIMSKRADELRNIGEGWRADGGQTAMLTLTIPHYKHQTLQSVMGGHKAKTGLAGAFARLRQHRQWREFKRQINYAADVRVYENTHGKNGFHSHIHAILYYKKDIDINSYAGQLYDLWANVCNATGLSTPSQKHGLKITKGTDEYLAKWGAPNELTSDQQKEAKNGNKTIAELENDLLIMEDTTSTEAILKEFYSTMQGRKLLTWGGENLRKRYLSEPDKTDTELAEDQHGDGERLFIIDGKTWQQIYNTGEVGEMLTAVENDNENGLFVFLGKYKINSFGVKRTLKKFDTQNLPTPKNELWGNAKWLN